MGRGRRNPCGLEVGWLRVNRLSFRQRLVELLADYPLHAVLALFTLSMYLLKYLI
jgi:hypothetical protein